MNKKHIELLHLNDYILKDLFSFLIDNCQNIVLFESRSFIPDKILTNKELEKINISLSTKNNEYIITGTISEFPKSSFFLQEWEKCLSKNEIKYVSKRIFSWNKKKTIKKALMLLKKLNYKFFYFHSEKNMIKAKFYPIVEFFTDKELQDAKTKWNKIKLQIKLDELKLESNRLEKKIVELNKEINVFTKRKECVDEEIENLNKEKL